MPWIGALSMEGGMADEWRLLADREEYHRLQAKRQGLPMTNISQIYLSDNNSAMGRQLERNSLSIRELIQEAKYRLYGDGEIKELIRNKFPPGVLAAYEALTPYAYKADLARYCILHEEGGWYFDIGMRSAGMQIQQVPSEVSLLAFRDINRYTLTSYACDNCIINSKPKGPAVAKAIELVVENVEQEYHGLTPLCPTGPNLWGRAIAMTGVDKSVIFGDSIELTSLHNNKNKAMVLPNGTILAYKKRSSGGDLLSLGAAGTNNYNELWHNRRVYQKPKT
jgi:Glycosyltransferase sugar-binding region containing DXD motif